MGHRQVPGVLAVTHRDADAPAVDVPALLAADGIAATIVDLGGITLATWGLGHDRPETDRPLLLSTTNWGDETAVAPSTLARWLTEGNLDRLGAMLPPFGALGLVEGGLRLVTDSMGFRQAFRATGDGWTAVSTSARLLGRLAGGGLDEEALLLQSQLGWQLGQRTLFTGVTKLSPGEAVLLTAGASRSELAPEARPEPGSVSLSDGVAAAAALLREFLERYLDEVPDPTLQLTGGQDSRLLLSAIPQARRKGLKVLTLDTPGSRDAEVAAALAARYGLVHTVKRIGGAAALPAAEWFERVYAQASVHDCMADPVARAGTAWAEESFEQGHRLSGLGGELGRGFYYTGWVHPTPVTRRRAEQLARWRMFTNEPVEPASLAAGHRERALPLGLDLAHAALVAGGPEWYTATDELYYRHRMQRWGGLGESAVSFERTLVNPMLDHRFRAIVRGLAPSDKHNSRFLGRLQVALDGELADLPLDNRPPPRVYATPGPVSFARQQATRAARLAGKVRQRLAGAHRPPPGGAVIAGKLAEHLAANPSMLDPVRGLGIFDEAWLDGVAAGTVRPAPSSFALLTNVLVAVDGGQQQ